MFGLAKLKWYWVSQNYPLRLFYAVDLLSIGKSIAITFY